MRKVVKHNFKRIEQDIAKDKRDPNMYWEAVNLKIINNGSNLSLTTHDGTRNVIIFNSVLSVAPNKIVTDCEIDGTNINIESSNLSFEGNGQLYNNCNVVGTTEVFGDLILTVVWSYGISDTLTVFYRLSENNGSHSLEQIYFQKLKMDMDRSIKTIFNYENEFISKIYWIDGINQLRSINLNDPELKDKDYAYPDMRPDTIMNPVSSITQDTSYGIMQKSVVQYCYMYYNNAGQESGLSPMSEPVTVLGDDTEVGSDTTTRTIEFDITGIDDNYDSIRVFRVQYIEGALSTKMLNPKVYIIRDELISSQNMHISDTQNTNDPEISLLELLNYGSDVIIPKYMESIKNRLLIGNYNQDQLQLNDFDSRAFSYDENASVTTVFDNPSLSGDYHNIFYSNPESYPPIDYNCTIHETQKHTKIYTVNSSYNDVEDGYTGFGATGKYLELRIRRQPHYIHSFNDNKSFKQRETYRVGIEYYNKSGQSTPVYWITDLYIPSIPITDKKPPVLSIECIINSNGRQKLADMGIVNYKLLYVERGVTDMSVITQGFIVPIRHNIGWQNAIASPMVQCVTNLSSGHESSDGLNCSFHLQALHTPDADFKTVDYRGTHVNIIGQANIYTSSIDGSWPGHECVIESEMLTPADFISGTYTTTHATSYSGQPVPHAPSSGKNKFYVNKRSFSTWNTSPLFDYNTRLQNIELRVDPVIFDGENAHTYNLHDISVKNTSGSNEPYFEDVDENHAKLLYRTSSFYALYFDYWKWHRYHDSTGFDYDKFVRPENTRYGLPIIELSKKINNQYSGFTYETKQNNEFIPISKTVSIDSICHGYGDVYIQEYNIRRSRCPGGSFSTNYIVFDEFISVMLESNVNLRAREDKTKKYGFGNFSIIGSGSGTGYKIGVRAGFEYDDFVKFRLLFSNNPGLTSYAKPFNFNIVENYELSLLISEKKNNNELSDSWLKFLKDDALTLDAKYGKITGLIHHNSRMIAFQERAVSTILVSPTAQQTSSTGGGSLDLVLGEGLPLHSYTYITTESGTMHDRSIVTSKSNVYYFDYYNKSISILSNSEGNELTTVLGLQTYFENYTDSSNILTNHNSISNNVFAKFNDSNELIYFSFNNDNNMTVSYSPLNKGFISFHTFGVTDYGKSKSNEYVVDGNTIQIFDKNFYRHYDKDLGIYRIPQKSVTILNSSNDYEIKRYDNIELSPINKGDYFTGSFDNWEVWNSYQNTGLISFNPSLRLRKHRAIVPRNERSMDRIRDDHAYFKLNFNKDAKMQLDALYVMYDSPMINNFQQTKK